MRRALTVLVCLLLLAGGYGAYFFNQKLVVHLPDYPTPRQSRWLPQDWASRQGAWFAHADQGTMTFRVPYEWFVALRQPVLFGGVGSGFLADPAYLNKFGFITEDAGLPVGIAKGQPALLADGAPWINPRTRAQWTGIGLTCSACHTGRLTYKGTELRIYGGAALTDLGKLRVALGLAVLFTDLLPARFDDFARHVLGASASDEQKNTLKAQLDTVLDGIKQEKALIDATEPRSVVEGYGRLDALNRIGNTVFAIDTGRTENYVPTNAPVHYPAVWDASWFTWVQYDGAIVQPMVRNAGEALGVSARLWSVNGVPRSSARVDQIFRIETALAGDTPPSAAKGFTGLTAPRWPEDILPPVDKARAAKGEKLYGELCAGCHLPPVGSAEFWSSPRWTAPNAAGERYLDLKMVNTAELGTDAAQARVLVERQVRLDSGSVLYAKALGETVEKTVNAWYDLQTPPLSAADRNRMNGNRPNDMQALLAYKARPLDGIWATPPYLHNGSVPNLYQLLSPVAERSKSFTLGNREYDPVNVGYVTGALANGFAMDTSLPGNSNAGHEFNGGGGAGVIGRKLAPEERLALVEFLKTL
jgi:mono/diheme cytochrome c family protein